MAQSTSWLKTVMLPTWVRSVPVADFATLMKRTGPEPIIDVRYLGKVVVQRRSLTSASDPRRLVVHRQTLTRTQYFLKFFQRHCFSIRQLVLPANATGAATPAVAIGPPRHH
jgi:hypothetical protein